VAARKSKKKPYTIVVEGLPTPKGRPRMTRRGRVFTPQRTLEAEARIAAAWTGPVYEGPVQMDCIFAREGVVVTVIPLGEEKSSLRGDLDNYVKLLMDGLNGVAWTDDKQVMKIVAVKL
jgi:crossover junction endodeoxyribonuclease RusA